MRTANGRKPFGTRYLHMGGGGEEHTEPFSFDPKGVELFWRQWDSVCARPEKLLSQKPVDWEGVRHTLQECNTLLLDSPDRALRRIVRLAKLSPLHDLSDVDRFIYVIYGHYPPYIGQTGCISGPRSPMQRYKEHLRKAISPHY